ncbi:hypothetical protein SLS55_006187 [Diplodia seriata]|uniref:Uncharacterized protein n=1 Tax=Diplodia seriata TaxID=420778 RepID=A0ABR3CDI5_9PEZI
MTTRASVWALSERTRAFRQKTPWPEDWAKFVADKFCPLSVFYRVIQLVADECSGQITADEAARSLSSLVLEQGDCLVDVHEATITYIIRAAVEVSDIGSAERLAALIACLARLPVAKNNSDRPLRYYDGSRDWKIQPGDTITLNDGRLWVDIPNFGMRMREAWDLEQPESTMGPYPSVEETREARDRWTALNAFAAHLVKSYGNEIERLHRFRLYALWTIRDALEYGFKSRYGKTFWLHIPAAAKWVEILGSEMRYWVDDYDNAPKAGGGTVWDADERGYGFSAERWAFWREQFRRFSTHKRLNKETQRIAAEAAERME